MLEQNVDQMLHLGTVMQLMRDTCLDLQQTVVPHVQGFFLQSVFLVAGQHECQAAQQE